jgi:hypothetical protein
MCSIMCSISSFPNEPGEEVADEIGGLPLHRVVDTPKPGDVIYVDTDLYVWHGVDDFHGGKVRVEKSGSKETVAVEVVQNPGTWYTWALLAEKQAELAVKFGDKWAHAGPDLRPEFNDDVC